jgi:hypothetical protein
MCNTNMKTNLYYANICKHKYEKNMTRLWCKIMPKINVNKGNEGSYFYLFLFGDLAQGSLQGNFYVCIE